MKFDRGQLRQAIRDQGWEIEETKSGFFAVPPTGDRIAWHNSPSDRRSDDNTMSEMRRHGFVWPWDKAAKARRRREQRGKGEDR